MTVVAPHRSGNGPQIFVITPYYQESLEWLRRCHDSVMNQQVDANITHVMVADGHPRPEIDEWNVTHIRLPKAHGDNGNTPRAVGCLIADTNGADFIAFLDADNWYYPDHLASMLAGHWQTGSSVMCSWREFYAPDGRKLAMVEAIEDNHSHVDTSCMMLHRSVFDLNAMWGRMPRILSPWCDRVFYVGINHRKLMLCFTRKRTVAFTTIYTNHYTDIGLTPPPNSKMPPEVEMVNYIFSSDGIREMAERLGFWFPIQWTNNPAAHPTTSPPLPSGKQQGRKRSGARR